MDWTNIIIAVCTAIGTIVILMGLLTKRFDKIDQRFDRIEGELKSQGERLSRIEGMMHWIERIFFDKTGTGKQ